MTNLLQIEGEMIYQYK